jgi:hypothetical protein
VRRFLHPEPRNASGRGSLFYLLRNRFYVGEVKYKDEILPGEQPAIMDRALFEAVHQKLTDQWTTRSTTRNASDHLLTGLLFDDVGHRMVPIHATKAGVRYRYYVSLPHLHGESKTASVGSVSRVPASDIENIIVKSLNEHLIAQKEKPAFSRSHVRDGKAALEQVARIDVHEDRLAVRFKSADDEETSDAADTHFLSIPWQKPPSRKSRQILIPHGVPKMKSVQRGSNVARASSAPSPEKRIAACAGKSSYPSRCIDRGPKWPHSRRLKEQRPRQSEILADMSLTSRRYCECLLLSTTVDCAWWARQGSNL